MSSTTQGERIATVENRVHNVERKVDEMNDKLDELLALRYKGVGAFWLMSALLGTGIVGFISGLIDWLRS